MKKKKRMMFSLFFSFHGVNGPTLFHLQTRQTRTVLYAHTTRWFTSYGGRIRVGLLKFSPSHIDKIWLLRLFATQKKIAPLIINRVYTTRGFTPLHRSHISSFIDTRRSDLRIITDKLMFSCRFLRHWCPRVSRRVAKAKRFVRGRILAQFDWFRTGRDTKLNR